MCIFFWKANKLVETDAKRVTNRTEQTNAGWTDYDQDHSWWRYNKIKSLALFNLYLVAQLLFLSFSILNWIPIQTTHDYLPNFYFLSFSIYIWIRIQASQDKKPALFIISNRSLFGLEFLFRLSQEVPPDRIIFIFRFSQRRARPKTGWREVLPL